MSIELEIDGVVHTITEEYLYWDTLNSYVVWAPDSFWWEHGNQANVSLLHCANFLGQNFSNAPLEFDFWLDFEPPVISFLSPPMGMDIMLRNQSPTISISLLEDLSGLDESSVALWIAGDSIGRPPATLDYEGDGLWALNFIPEAAGVQFDPGDTITVEVRACDTPDYCEPNCITVIDSFIIEPQIACLVFPNPFTPDGDPINRFAVFNYPHMYTTPGELVIFDVRNREIFKGTIGPVNDATELILRNWDGKDTEGKLVPEGLYIYVIKQDKEIICNGTVIVAR